MALYNDVNIWGYTPLPYLVTDLGMIAALGCWWWHSGRSRL